MKVLHLANSDAGGAGRAAYRLHQGLRSLAIDSQMLVQYKNHDDRSVNVDSSTLSKLISKLKLSEHLDGLPLKRYPDRDRTNFSPQWVMDRIPSKVEGLSPDIIDLHWICNGFLQIESLGKFRRPLVWTLHDMWPFTGGCHYTQECDRYTQSCGQCPRLNSHKDGDLSRSLWKRKAKAWKNVNLSIVTPSFWLAQCAKASSLFEDRRIEVIPNGLDLEQYKPIDRQVARRILNLPEDKWLILFGAMQATSDRRKGFHLLQRALNDLSQSQWRDRLELVIFGASRPQDPPQLGGFKSHYLGKLSDEISLAIVYAAADVFVAPSLQDNLPNTVIEALACGTPVVAFNIGGMPDLIRSEYNGYLAKAYESQDFARGITWLLENQERYQKIRNNARLQATTEWNVTLQANRYKDLFQDILSLESKHPC
ncbi:MAG: glycosyltransferase family 4 protein [Roseofilum sp. Belize BBD 4]|uniref:glycosyltransferase family 4 protein n=1 Tax=Roseofilum sp. Belize BBD 4 TaxID=2821500 RepID=UPI000E9579B8|nr:glycosyltransferase family 4 protein [Roseofilum sp. Belize BBD 4]MBP0032835.1 glycosyltransferase family 4 protein [Roseofilum sp. Belize BBD 4]HBQ99724.1 glycosyl transferase [Cyanobacteria bacterium UBA11691]